MPVIARFYGIIIKMYFSQSEHGIPHFHAVYGEFTAYCINSATHDTPPFPVIARSGLAATKQSQRRCERRAGLLRRGKAAPRNDRLVV